MKVLKTIGIILLALVGLFFFAALIAPKSMEVERSIVIEAPPEVVFNTVNDLRTWESWSPWKEMDPTMKVTMGKTAVGAGAAYSWTAEEAGSGTMRILSSTPNKAIDTEVEFDGMGSALGHWTFIEVDSGTQANWGFSSRPAYPWNIMYLFFGPEAVEKDFDRGLELLKEHVEEQYAESKKEEGLAVREVELPERQFVAIRKKVNMSGVTGFYAENLPKVQQLLAANSVEPAGMPCGLYYSWDETNQETDLAGAIPVPTLPPLDKDFEAIVLPPGKALLVEYYGPYEAIASAHTAIDDYTRSKNLQTGFPVIEQYVTDPSQEPDPGKWLTRVFYPVEE